jgi:hypoxanthine phosphoribosyltransferase
MSWEDVEKSCEKIYKDMVNNNYVPDVIIGLLWGGVVPTRLMVDLLGHERLNTHVIYTSLYDGVGKRKKTVDIDLRHFNGNISNKKVLIIDDIWDTGTTMRAVLKELIEHNCEVSTATIVYKNTNSMIAPNYYDHIIDKDSSWIVFPWEKNEFLRETHS